MEIGIVSWTYPPENSGLAVAAREIAQALAEAGHGVRVMTFDRTGRTRDGAVIVVGCALPADGRAARWRKRAGVGHLVGPWAIGQCVAKEHGRRRFAMVEGTNWYAPGLFVALDGTIPYFTRNSTPAATSGASAIGVRARFDGRIAAMLEGVAARRSAGLISNTQAHGAKIAALYGVPPPGPGHAIVGLSLDPAMIAAGAAAAYPVAGPVRLLFVGRADPRKGYDALEQAIGMLAGEAAAGRIPAFQLTMVGIAPERTAGPYVTAIARAEPEQLRALLAEAHVVVAPSRYESFGLVYQEAMAFGRPIVACAEDPSARLFVGESGAGVLAERCDGPAVAAALRALIVDPALRARLHIASRAGGGRFSRATLARDTVAAYAQALSNGRSSASSSAGRAPLRSIAP